MVSDAEIEIAVAEAAHKLGIPPDALIGFAESLADVDQAFTADDLVWAWRDGPGALEAELVNEGKD